MRFIICKPKSTIYDQQTQERYQKPNELKHNPGLLSKRVYTYNTKLNG